MNVGIVGCGTAGLSAALFLARAGHRVHIVDRARSLMPIGAGFLLQPTGLAVLHQLKLLPDIVKNGAPVHKLYGVTDRGRVVMNLDYNDLSPGLCGMGVQRGLIFDTLYQAALKEKQVNITTGITAVDVKSAGDGTIKKVIVDEAGQSYGAFDMVIVADGARSRIREKLVPGVKASLYPWGCFWVIARDTDGIYSGKITQVFKSTSQMNGFMPSGFGPALQALHSERSDASVASPANLEALTDPKVPVPGGGSGDPEVERLIRERLRLSVDREHTGTVTMFWSLPVAEIAELRAKGLDAFKDKVRKLSTVANPVLDQLHDMDQLLSASYYDVVMHPMHKENIVFMGDCAHAMSPQLGQGANLALVDAGTFAECLAEKPDRVLEAAEEFTRRRKDHVTYYTMASRWLTPVFQSHRATVGTLRDMLFNPSCYVPYIRGQMLASMAGLKTGLIGRLPVPPDAPRLAPPTKR